LAAASNATFALGAIEALAPRGRDACYVGPPPMGEFSVGRLAMKRLCYLAPWLFALAILAGCASTNIAQRET
jgi:hypothetical protein